MPKISCMVASKQPNITHGEQLTLHDIQNNSHSSNTTADAMDHKKNTVEALHHLGNEETFKPDLTDQNLSNAS